MTTPKVLDRVRLENGKYEWVLYDNYASEVFRHAESWKNTAGDNFTLAAMQEIILLQAELEQAIEFIENSGVDWDEIRGEIE